MTETSRLLATIEALEIELGRKIAENLFLEEAIKTLIKERDCAIADINQLANWVIEDDEYYLQLGENAQGVTEYISVTITTKDGEYKEIWRGVKR